MTEIIFTVTTVAFFCLLGYTVEQLLKLTDGKLLLEILTYYVIGDLLMGLLQFSSYRLYACLQNTKGRMVGYKDHKTYGDSSIYENTPSDNTNSFLN